jgi:hypothetical protein
MKSSVKNLSFVVVVSAVSVAVSVMMSACGSSNQSSQGSSAAQPDQSQNWALSYQAACPASTAAESCVGQYGFNVDSDGNYQVGPGPHGEIDKGKLSVEEFKSISQLASPAITSTAAATSAEACSSLDYSDSQDYSLTLTKHAKKAIILQKKGADLCSNRFKADASDKFHEAFIALVAKYYVTPFPSACHEAAKSVSLLYPAVEGCKVDADCAYLDQNYNPIPTDGENTVYIDNCSVVKSLPAANAKSTLKNIKALQDALANARTICGFDIARPNCQGALTFASTAAPAVCHLGACEVNPALGF